MRRGFGLLSGLGALAALTLTGCAPASLPLSIPDGMGLCSDSDLTRSGSIGVPITNTSSTPITLSDAYPSGVSQLDVLGTWIVSPNEQSADLPVFAGDQDPDEADLQWFDREKPDGAVIEAGESRYLVVVASLSDGSDSGWIEGVTVSSSDGAASAPGTGWGLTPGGASCPWSPPGGNVSPSPSGP